MEGDGKRRATKSDPPEVLTRRQQHTTAVLAGVSLLILAASWTWDWWRFGRPINIDKAYQPPHVELKIDINKADWPELTLLPEISETMARRIVTYRDQLGGFEQLDQIMQVQGIGPRTLERMEPYLFPVAASSHPSR